MTHRFEGHSSVTDTCVHRFTDDTGYEYICGEASLAPVHSVKPVGGYADGTSGHSGTETSEARVRRDDANGTTAERQERALRWLGYGHTTGGTVKELREAASWHHGVASAALTNLHKAGKIARLAEVRDGCKVYVLPEYVGDRETEAYASRSPKPEPLTTEERTLVTGLLMDYGVEVVDEAQAHLAWLALEKIKAGAQ